MSAEERVRITLTKEGRESFMEDITSELDLECIYLFNRYLLNKYYVPADIAADKADTVSTLQGDTVNEKRG